MAVALRDLERGHPRSRLRVVPTPASRPPRHVFWLRRAVILAMMAGVLLIAVAGMSSVGGRAGDRGEMTRTDLTVVVAPGETLWQIAERYAPQDRDMVEWTSEIARANGVDARTLQPGTPLVIPIETVAVSADLRPAEH